MSAAAPSLPRCTSNRNRRIVHFMRKREESERKQRFEAPHIFLLKGSTQREGCRTRAPRARAMPRNGTTQTTFLSDVSGAIPGFCSPPPLRSRRTHALPHPSLRVSLSLSFSLSSPLLVPSFAVIDFYSATPRAPSLLFSAANGKSKTAHTPSPTPRGAVPKQLQRREGGREGGGGRAASVVLLSGHSFPPHCA